MSDREPSNTSEAEHVDELVELILQTEQLLSSVEDEQVAFHVQEANEQLQLAERTADPDTSIRRE